MIYLDAPRSGQVIYGLTAPFKRNVSGQARRKRSRGNVLHLGHAKTELTTVVAQFSAVYSGTLIEVGEFNYASNNDLLTIVNLQEVIGIQIAAISAGLIPGRAITKLGNYGAAFGTVQIVASPISTTAIPLLATTAVDADVVIGTIEAPMVSGA